MSLERQFREAIRNVRELQEVPDGHQDRAQAYIDLGDAIDNLESRRYSAITAYTGAFEEAARGSSQEMRVLALRAGVRIALAGVPLHDDDRQRYLAFAQRALSDDPSLKRILREERTRHRRLYRRHTSRK